VLRACYSFLYLIWAVVSLPILFYKKWVKKKEIHFLSKIVLPKYLSDSNQKTLWLHAVSLGEMKAALWLISELKKRKSFSLIITTQTATGYQFAKNNFDAAVFFLPLDFYFLQKKLVDRFKPNVFILMESDFWLNQLLAIKEHQAKTFLINGKLSKRSFERLKKFPLFTKTLFSCFDHMIVQGEKMKELFTQLSDNKSIDAKANIKLLKTPNAVIGLFPQLSHLKLITIACSHPGEEIEILDVIFPLIKQGFQIAVAPRHPERFEEVFFELKERFKEVEKLSSNFKAPIYLVDQMGILNEIYAKSTYVIMGGSFCSKKGGHDIFEPIMQGVFTFFGPYMHAQSELTQLAIHYQLGKMQTAENLAKAITDKEKEKKDSQAFLKDFQNLKNMLKISYESVFEIIAKEI
jgi:3-deoxy-D-manno-octulosonic-acid transferase